MTIAKTVNPNNLGASVVTRNFSWRDFVMRSWGSEFNAPDHGAYEFSNGKQYDSTDLNSTGIYGGGANT